MKSTSRCTLGLGAAMAIAIGFAAFPTYADGTAAKPAAKPQTKAAPAAHVGVRSVSPEAKAAFARLKSLFGDAVSIQYESSMSLTSGGTGAGPQTFHVIASVQKPNLVAITVTIGSGQPITAVTGPAGAFIYDTGSKKYAQTDAPCSEMQTLSLISGLAKGIDSPMFSVSLNNVIANFYMGGSFNLADSIPAQADLTAATKDVDVDGQKGTDIVQTVNFQGQHITIDVVVNSSTGLPLKISETMGAAGHEVTPLAETFKTFTASKDKLAEANFQFEAPSDGKKVDVPREELGLAGLANGAAAPDFSVIGTDGATIKLSKFAGKVVVIDFWSTWCGPCQQSLPNTDKIARQYQAKGVVFLPICSWDTKDKFTAWTKDRKAWAMHFFFDANDQSKSIASTLYKVTGIPTQYIVGTDGKVADSFVGYGGESSDTSLRTSLDRALSGVKGPAACEATPRTGAKSAATHAARKVAIGGGAATQNNRVANN